MFQLKSWKFCGVDDECKKGNTVVEGHRVCMYMIMKEENAKGEVKEDGTSKGKKKGKKRSKRYSLGGKSSVVMPDSVSSLNIPPQGVPWVQVVFLPKFKYHIDFVLTLFFL